VTTVLYYGIFLSLQTRKNGIQNIQNATRGFLTALECTKFVFGWGSAPHPAGGTYSTPAGPLAGLREPTFKGKENWRGRRMEGRGGTSPLT